MKLIQSMNSFRLLDFLLGFLSLSRACNYYQCFSVNYTECSYGRIFYY